MSDLKVMIPMSRLRSVLEIFGEEEEVPLGIFLVIPASERPPSPADIKRAQEIYAHLKPKPR